MCYICRRIYFELEGWDYEWSTGPHQPPTDLEKRLIPCETLAELMTSLGISLRPDPVVKHGIWATTHGKRSDLSKW